MNSTGTKKNKNLKASIVIIGGGGAGIASAVAAAEKGVSNIVVLEKRGVVGGNSAMAQGPFAAESPAQRRQAIITRKDDLFKIAMDYAHWKTNPRIVRAFIDKSADTIRWLEEKGVHFECIPHTPNDVALTWHVSKGEGREQMKVLAKECHKLGVEVLVRTPAKKILTGSKGNITGVLAETKGEEFAITSGSVIIATGGYSGNVKLLKKYCPEYRDNMPRAGLSSTGDGLVMATEIGAATEGLGILMMGGPSVPMSIALKVGTEPNIVPVRLWAIHQEPSNIWVNKKGRRFINEAIGNLYNSGHAVVRQPDSLSYTLFDTKMVQLMTERGLAFPPAAERNREAQRSKLPAGLERELQIQADKGAVKMSDSWDEIAEWIGADPKILKNTIDEYNAACDQGYDPVFAKDRTYLLPLRTPPYYAIRCECVILNTIGGIKINEHMEVLDKWDNPIPGLYAAGVDTGGWTSDTYCVILPGTAYGFALNSGRIAGENAARFVLKK